VYHFDVRKTRLTICYPRIAKLLKKYKARSPRHDEHYDTIFWDGDTCLIVVSKWYLERVTDSDLVDAICRIDEVENG